MPTWEAIQAKAIAAVDAKLAEAVGLFFLDAGAVDLLRPKMTTRGMLRAGRGDGQVPEGRGAAWGMRIAAGKAQLHLSRETYLGPQIRRGDKVKALDRAGQPMFAVERVDDRTPGRIVLELVET